MDFLERIFHINPDHGSGLTELGICLAFMAIPLLARALWNKFKRSA